MNDIVDNLPNIYAENNEFNADKKKIYTAIVQTLISIK